MLESVIFHNFLHDWSTLIYKFHVNPIMDAKLYALFFVKQLNFVDVKIKDIVGKMI